MTAAIYIRVSTSKKVAPDVFRQNISMQEEPLRKMARDRGWGVVAIYQDRMSGADPNRPQFKRLMEDARRGKFQVVMVWKFDRFARSLSDLLSCLETFNQCGIRFISYTEAIDTSTPAGKALFSSIGIFAEFERSMLIERVRAGIEHAREHGTKSGKAIGRPRVIFNRLDIVNLRARGLTFPQIAKQLGIGVGTAHREHSRILSGQKGQRKRIHGT